MSTRVEPSQIDDAQAVPAAGRPWLRRVVPKILFALYARLDRATPGLTDLLERGVERVLRFQRRVRFSRFEDITLRAGDARFQLRLVGGSQMSHDDYGPLAQSGGVYEPVATACLTRVLRALPDAGLMDIGAFIGYFTCYYAALFGDRRPIWAVESNPAYCEVIRQIIALNGFKRPRVLQAALSDRTEAVSIDGVTVLSSGRGAPDHAMVQAITLDDLCAREGIAPAVVKIDVHGFEGKVLRGMPRLLQESIQVVLLELHTVSVFKRHSSGITRLELLDWLEHLGFSLFHVSGHRQEERTDAAAYLEEGRFAYAPLTAATRPYLLFDRQFDVLVLAIRGLDIAALLGPSVELTTAVG